MLTRRFRGVLGLGLMQDMVCMRRRSFLFGVMLGFMASLVIMPFFEDCGEDGRDRKPKELPSNWFEDVINSDLNPVVNLNPDNQSRRIVPGSVKNTPLVKRPRYYSTELGIKSNLLVGILTTSQTLSLALAVNRTLNSKDSKTLFFVESPSAKVNEANHLANSLVVLPSNHSEYFVAEEKMRSPSTKFSFFFKVLNYLFTQTSPEDGSTFVRSHNFILLLKDQVHVKRDNLLDYLARFPATRSVFALTAKRTELVDLCGALSPEFDVQFGLLLNQNLLLECNFNITCWRKFCLQNNLESYPLLYSNNDELTLDEDEFAEVVVSYPLYTSNGHYHLHKLYLNILLKKKFLKIQQLEQCVHDVQQIVGTEEWPLGVDHRFQPQTRFDVIRWFAFNDSHVLMPDDFETAIPLKKDDLIDIAQVKELCEDHLASERNKTEVRIEFKNIYRRFDPVRGMEYIVDVHSREDDTGLFQLKRFEVLKPLNPVEIMTQVPYVTESSRVLLILPITNADQAAAGAAFLDEYANNCLNRANHQTNLVLVLVYFKRDSGKDVYASLKSLASSLQSKYKNTSAKVVVVSFKIEGKDAPSNSLIYIDLVSLNLPRSSFENSVVLLCKIHTLFSYEFINRVRLNTIRRYQVFFPIPFVEYKLRPEKQTSPVVTVKKGQGHFFEGSSDICSFYFSDYIAARDAIKEIIPVPSNERDIKEDNYESDWDLMRLFLHYNCEGSGQMHILKGVEPELKMLFHNEYCEKQSNVYIKDECEAYNVFRMGTRSQLASVILSYEQSRNIDNRISDSKPVGTEDD